MPIKWKSPNRFDPSPILSRIDAARTISPNGGASFRGFEWEEYLPALHSMLEFPQAASGMDTQSLLWRALTKVSSSLNPSSFLNAANGELATLLANKELQYRVLTSVSVSHTDIPSSISCLGVKIRFLGGPFPKRYKSRDMLISNNHTGIGRAPNSYTRVIVSLKAKTHDAAISKAMRALDLQRALWCLIGNFRMQISFGTPVQKPINVIRLGGHHTLHTADGKPARESIWFEPSYVEASVFSFSKPQVVRERCNKAHRLIQASPYRDQLISALVRYVRALDESDANTAFPKLWAAVETLATPGVADYPKLVRRCAFLFKEGEFHIQMLEHLREFRNSTVHAGEYSEKARTYCYQLQMYFDALIWFHIIHAKFFHSLEEANQFLEMPSNQEALRRRIKLARRALKFIS